MTIRSLGVAPFALLLASCATTQPITPQIAPETASFAGAERVEIALDSFSYAPETIALRAGQPVVLVLVNQASGGHNFAAPEFFAAAQVASEEADLIASGAIEVKGGQSVEVHLIPAAGTYDLECTHVAHSVLGMTGSIVVE